jgi:hypothetical protein
VTSAFHARHAHDHSAGLVGLVGHDAETVSKYSCRIGIRATRTEACRHLTAAVHKVDAADDAGGMFPA